MPGQTGVMSDAPLWLSSATNSAGTSTAAGAPDRDVVLIESAAALRPSTPSTGRSCTSCSPACGTSAEELGDRAPYP